MQNGGVDVNELGRRRQATFAPLKETVAAFGTCNRKFKSDEQQYAVINVSHTRCRPASKEPAIRILGLFPDIDSATEFATNLYTGTDHRCSIRVVDTCGWHLAAESEHAPYAQTHAKVLKILKKKWEEVVHFEEEFTENYKNVHIGRNKPKQKNAAVNPAFIIARQGLKEMAEEESKKVKDKEDLSKEEISKEEKNLKDLKTDVNSDVNTENNSDNTNETTVEYLPINSPNLKNNFEHEDEHKNEREFEQRISLSLKKIITKTKLLSLYHQFRIHTDYLLKF